MSPGNRNNRHRETVRHGRMQIIPDGDTKRLPCGVRGIDPADYRETYKPLISRAIFLIFFLLVSASFFFFFFFRISLFIFHHASRAWRQTILLPLPVHASLDALMSREWFFCPIVKCNNQIRILGWAGDERGTPGRLSFSLVSRRDMICTCKLFEIALANITRCVSSN